MLSRRRLFSLPAAAVVPALADPSEPLDLPEDFESSPEDTLAGLQRLSANRKYYKARLKIQAEYRDRLAEILGLANRVTLYLLDFAMIEKPDSEEDENRYYYIKPYKLFSTILQTRELDAKDRGACIEHLQRLLRTRGDETRSAFCHYPIHAVRVHLDDDILFSTSFCWKCSNYFVPYPDDDSATWVGLNDPVLEKFLKAQLPIPASEIERFRRSQEERPK